MANEITFSAALNYSDSESASIGLGVNALSATVATKKYMYSKMSVTTAALAINLGPVSSLGWGVFINRDTTNYLQLLTSNGGVAFARLGAGQAALFYFGSGVTAPYAQANTAACQMEYLICSQ
jgi:hypothetical protein